MLPGESPRPESTDPRPPFGEPTPAPAAAGGGRGVGAGVAAAGALAVVKSKGALGLLKALPFGKLALTGGSAAVMVLLEGMRSGLPFALGFVALIFVHEMGHAVAIRRAGLQAGWPVFIPFFGAMIALKGRTPDADTEAEIAFGGPVAGTAASLACAAAGLALHSRLALHLAYVGFFLNLFNLVPVSPLDGGRVAQAFSRRAWLVGGLLLGGMFLTTGSPQLLIIGLMAIPQAIRRSHGEGHAALSPELRQTWALRYFGLCFFLGAAVYLCRRLITPPGA
ncbi:MAG TPA: site-2 protease family protein [Polyangiaceae bacterium]|nr:site-2 protease family protein [Polyangiaceae bacterium]